jgi:hypothetical protein
VFVIITRGAMGGYKVRDRFPLTEEGWASARQTFAQGADTNAARRVRAELETPVARAAGLEPEPDTTPVLIVTTNDMPGYRIAKVHGDFGLSPVWYWTLSLRNHPSSRQRRMAVVGAPRERGDGTNGP